MSNDINIANAPVSGRIAQLPQDVVDKIAAGEGNYLIYLIIITYYLFYFI